MPSNLALYIDGRFISGGQRVTEPVLEPATGEAIGDLPHATPAELDEAVAAATRAFPPWRDTSPYARAQTLRRAADLIRERSDHIARIMTREQGKIVSEAMAELAHAADLFDWYAEEGRRTYGRVVPARSRAVTQLVLLEPVGPCAVFTPWNFPALTPSRKLAAGLAAGCTLVLKASEETPGTAVEIVRALHDAGLPPGCANLVFGVPAEVSERLLKAPQIRKISFTGSTAVGIHLMKLAAETAKRTTMELGGNAPVVVFEDADLDLALDTLAAGKFRNAGQVCVSPARFFVHESKYEAFTKGFAERAAKLVVDNGLEAAAQMGPLANPRRVEAMERIVADAEARGGQVTTLARPNRPGNFFMPTIVTEVGEESLLLTEETFGPVVPILPFSTAEEALARANSVEAGLAGYAFTQGLKNAHIAMHGIECGMVGLNTLAVSTPETPFGGIKHSGHGQEGGTEGLQAYLNVKLVAQA